MMKKLFSIVLLFVAGLSFSAFSQITWDGGGATDIWSNALNWSGDVVPNLNEHAKNKNIYA